MKGNLFSSKKKIYSSFLLCILLAGIVFTSASCSAGSLNLKSKDLMQGIKGNKPEGKNIDDKFISSSSDFSLKLFKKGLDKEKNSLISPTSVMLALAMTANGAEGKTLTELEYFLGKDITIEELNNYLYSYMKNLPSEAKAKLNIANSIWFRDNEKEFTAKSDFLQRNADYYKASIYKSDFDSPDTVKDINKWVENKTNGMIDNIVDRIDKSTVMYLINAIAFEGEWETIYKKSQIFKGDFTDIKGNKKSMDFMSSDEGLYLEDNKTTGFIKPYAGNKHSFAALLPKENININDYISSLNGESFLKLLKDASNESVQATIPKFSYEYGVSLNEALIDMGVKEAFKPSAANFSKLGNSPLGNIYIGDVLHKTFIAVDEKGTKAGAVTKVEMKVESAMNHKTVILNRPFVYAIIDNQTNLPVFIGTVIN